MRPTGRTRPGADAPRYLRPGGNRRVRRRRLTRTALRASAWCALWLAGAAAAAAGFRETWRHASDPSRFPLRRVVVEGGGPAARAEVESLLAPLVGRNVFTIDLAEVERDVRGHRWVRAAAVRRRLPGALLVLIEPRHVEALVLAGNGVRMVDREGSDLGAYAPGHAGEDGPVITGVSGGVAGEGAGRLRRGIDALRSLRESAPEFLAGVSTLDVSRRDRITATLRDYRPPVLLSPEEPARNLERLDAVRGRLRREGVEAGYVDLRFRERVAVMPIRADEEGVSISG